MENQEFNNTNQYAQSEIVPMKPKSWLTESILVTIIPLCCMCIFSLLGIVAIVNASKVDVLYFAGQYQEAERVSKNAKMWFLITLTIFLVFLIGYILYMSVVGWDTFMDAFREGYESVRRGGGTMW